MKPKKLDFDLVWPGLRTIVQNVMLGTVTRSEWQGSYSDVYALCVAQPVPFYEKLYTATKEFLREYVEGLRIEVLEKSKQAGLLGAYYNEWCSYWKGVAYLDRLYIFLNHEWVKKERVSMTDINYGALDADEVILEIGELGLDIWMSSMLQPLQEDLFRLVLNVVHEDRLGNTTNLDARYVKEVVVSFVEAGKFRKKGTSEFYKIFERRYLDATNMFYSVISRSLIGNISCSTFMEKVLHFVDQEKLRSRRFLDPSSFSRVIKECERVMVGDHLEFIYDEAHEMAATLKRKDLQNMYTLLKPLGNNCMQPLIKEVQNRIEKVGKEALQDIDPDNAAQSFVDRVLKVYYDYRQVVHDVFNNDQHFIGALDRAYTSVINSSHPNITCKAPELLARYCDQILKKGPRGPGGSSADDIEGRLSKTIVVFKYLDEKDYFQKSYSKLLAKRLIHGMSASMEAEEQMINMLKSACGFEYTSKLHRMYTDMTVSGDLNAGFSVYLTRTAGNTNLGLTLSMSVLQACAWPMSTQPVSTFAPPQQLERSITLFEAFYKAKFSGRKLTWLHNLSNADVRLNFPSNGKSYTMTCSTFTMAVVLLFEHEDCVSYERLRSSTQLQDDYLTRALQALVEAKILQTEESNSVDSPSAGSSSNTSSSREAISPSTNVQYGSGSLFFLNFQFSHRRAKFKITSSPVKEQVTGQEQEQTAASLEDDRKAYLQALIVRIMKVRKVAKHSELIEEVIAQATDRFRPNVATIKKCIEGLIDKQYIERMPNSADEYSYVS